MVGRSASTSGIAAATGYSVQQIRDLEALGVITPARRAANGYRHFSVRHITELSVYRDLADAVGAVEARHVLRDVRVLPAEQAVALVGSLHVRLAADRDLALAARRALQIIGTEPNEPDTDTDSMTITRLAEALDVRTSTLRFWEKEGLLHPERVSTRAGTARRYSTQAIQQARIVAALRAAGYRIPELRVAMDSMRQSGPSREALAALDERLSSIARRTLALLRAGGWIAEIITPGTTR